MRCHSDKKEFHELIMIDFECRKNDAYLIRNLKKFILVAAALIYKTWRLVGV